MPQVEERLIQVGDVFSFKWYEAEEAKRQDPSHCFDGQLIALELPHGLHLVDTYWIPEIEITGHIGSASYFTLSEALRLGELSFKCNLNEVVRIPKTAVDYYELKDIFDLSHQHRSYGCIAVRKGAKRSGERMRQAVYRQVEEEKRRVSGALSRVEWLGQCLGRINAGDLDVSI